MLLHDSARAGVSRLGSSAEPGELGGAPRGADERGHRGLQPRGGVGARARRRQRAGRRHLPDGRLHRAAPRRAAGAALARRRLRRLRSCACGRATRAARSRARSPARCARSRSRQKWPRRSRGSPGANGSPATTTSSSRGRPATTSTARRCGAATTSRCARAGLRPLRFHDLRHTFGTRVIAKVDIRRVQEWMGHADVQTTMRYLHFVPRAEDARAGGRGVSGGAAAVRGCGRALRSEASGGPVTVRGGHRGSRRPACRADGGALAARRGTSILRSRCSRPRSCALVAAPDRGRAVGALRTRAGSMPRLSTPSAWLKVVVAYAEGRGYVVTAYPRRSMP